MHKLNKMSPLRGLRFVFDIDSTKISPLCGFGLLCRYCIYKGFTAPRLCLFNPI